jgi:hypothetical protein
MQPLQKQLLLQFQLRQLPQKLERILHESVLVPPKKYQPQQLQQQQPHQQHQQQQNEPPLPSQNQLKPQLTCLTS